MRRWPYALPNIISAMFLFAAIMALYLGLEEASLFCLSLELMDQANYHFRRTKHFEISPTWDAKLVTGS